jgi:hypothetical protein
LPHKGNMPAQARNRTKALSFRAPLRAALRALVRATAARMSLHTDNIHRECRKTPRIRVMAARQSPAAEASRAWAAIPAGKLSHTDRIPLDCCNKTRPRAAEELARPQQRCPVVRDTARDKNQNQGDPGTERDPGRDKIHPDTD